MKGIHLGDKEMPQDILRPILSNEKIFAVNLYEVGLAEKIEEMFLEMMAGAGAVRATLQKYLG